MMYLLWYYTVTESDWANQFSWWQRKTNVKVFELKLSAIVEQQFLFFFDK